MSDPKMWGDVYVVPTIKPKGDDAVNDRLCTPFDLAGFLDQDLVTAKAALVIEAATAVVQSLVGERIVDAYPAGSQELLLARTAVLMLAAALYTGPRTFDYEKAYKIADAAMEQSPHWQAALKLQYERRVAVLTG